ncbi:aspartyl-phosphate phosphatase Spo0E family protein [Priestia megaterium]|nr:aspartyl-phosphate phosphatase Spo0E family protein [Priestia megaterium]MCY9020255.1 aspartyl-phosphate phosphatase Spo0E family protein [Priestia megaterium]MDY0943667.1 aspartyl-phosphate phosphatase Spo0E family protein [Priestia megaterium]
MIWFRNRYRLTSSKVTQVSQRLDYLLNKLSYLNSHSYPNKTG